MITNTTLILCGMMLIFIIVGYGFYAVVDELQKINKNLKKGNEQ